MLGEMALQLRGEVLDTFGDVGNYFVFAFNNDKLYYMACELVNPGDIVTFLPNVEI